MLHFGDEDYFKSVLAEAAELEDRGYTVHYERIHEVKDVDWADLYGKIDADHIDRAKMEHQEIVKAFCEALDAEYQSAYMDEYRDTWQNHDMHAGQFLATIGVLRARKASEKSMVELFKEHPESIRWIFKNFGARVSILRILGGLVNRLITGESRLIVNHRDSVAIQAVFDQMKPGSSFVLLWGAGHLPGMRKLLKAAGFQDSPTQSMWRTALTIE